MHSLDNNWRSKGYQTMKFEQIIDDKVRNIFIKGHAKSDEERSFKISFCFMR